MSKRKTDEEKAETARLKKIRLLARLKVKRDKMEIEKAARIAECEAAGLSTYVYQSWIPTPEEIEQRAAEVRALRPDGVEITYLPIFDMGYICSKHGRIVRKVRKRRDEVPMSGIRVIKTTW